MYKTTEFSIECDRHETDTSNLERDSVCKMHLSLSANKPGPLLFLHNCPSCFIKKKIKTQYQLQKTYVKEMASSSFHFDYSQINVLATK